METREKEELAAEMLIAALRTWEKAKGHTAGRGSRRLFVDGLKADSHDLMVRLLEMLKDGQ